MTEINTLLSLIRCAIGQQEIVEYDDKLDVDGLVKLIKKQEIVSLVFHAIAAQKNDRWRKAEGLLQDKYNQTIHKTLMQQIEVEAFLSELENQGEDCLPLKGWIMREYYPDVTFRSMTDFDILIKDFDSNRYKSLMERLGYESHSIDTTNHDEYVKHPYVVIELHRSLATSKLQNEASNIAGWLDSIWDKWKRKEGTKHIHVLSPEDFYIYHMIHMYKHMRVGGSGIRPIIDIGIFMEKKEKELDWKYLNHTFAELKLDKFEYNMRRLSKVCFFNAMEPLTEKDYKLLDFVLGSGLYGSKQIEAAGEMAKAKGKSQSAKKLSFILKTVFLPLNEMTIRFPLLKRYAFLLPICWIIRVFKMAFGGKLRLFMKGTKKKAYEEMQEIYMIAGIEE